MSLLLNPHRHATAAPAGFSPDDNPDLHAWYDADALTGLSDTDPVSSWADATGAGQALTQATGSRQPLYRTGIQNGLPVVRFDGSDDVLSGAFTGLLSQPITYVIAVALSGTQGDMLIDGDDSSNRCAFGATASSSSDTGMWAGSVGPTVSSQTFDFGIWTCIFDGASSVMRHNGVQQSLAAYVGANGLDGLTLGGRYALDVGRFYPADVGELLVYDAALTGTDLTDIENHLAGKWVTDGTPRESAGYLDVLRTGGDPREAAGYLDVLQGTNGDPREASIYLDVLRSN